MPIEFYNVICVLIVFTYQEILFSTNYFNRIHYYQNAQTEVVYIYNLCRSHLLPCAHGQYRRSAQCNLRKEARFGKLWLGVIHVILLQPLQHTLSHILQTGWPVILHVVVCRHSIYKKKEDSTIFNCLYNAVSCTIWYMVSVTCLISITICSYASTRVESIG